MKSQEYALEQVFTYSSPAVNTYVERHEVNKQFHRAIIVPGTQIILFGHSGTGKSTLLLNKCLENNIERITCQCVTGTTLQNIIEHAFSMLDVYTTNSKETTSVNNVEGGANASLFGMGVKGKIATAEERNHVETRIGNIPINPQTIAKYLGEAGKCLVIEDFHKMKPAERAKLAQMMKVFMDASVEYPKVKIIAIGAVNSAREMLQLDRELKNRVCEIEVPLMNSDELENILRKGSDLLNITFPDRAIKRIIDYSCGLPGVVHQLAYLMCEYNKIRETYKRTSTNRFPLAISHFDDAIDDYLTNQADSYKAKYETATRINRPRKYNNPIDILRAILLTERSSISIDDIKRFMQKFDRTYTGVNLKKYVEELMTDARGKILSYNKESKQYYFTDPLFQVYCKCIFRIDSTYSNKVRIAVREIEEEDRHAARQAFLDDVDDIFNDDDFNEDYYIMEQSDSLIRR